MEIEKNKHNDALIIAGMKFANINACTHRMLGIAQLFLQKCDNVFLFGVSDAIDKGVYCGFEFNTVIYPKKITKWVKFTFSAKEYLKEIKRHQRIKYVVVNGSVPSIPTIKIAKYCKKHDIDFIFDIGEWYTSNNAGFLKKIIKYFDTQLKMRYICKKYYNYIVASSFLANHCGDGKNILTLPALVTNKIDVLNKNTKKLENSIIKLSFIGMLEKNKAKEDLEPLIDGINEFNYTHSLKFILDVVGADGKNSAYVFYYGKRSYTDCINFLINSDFTVIPRGKTRKNQSGFPTKLSESFLYGIPVISTDTSDISEYLINGENGFLIPSNDKESYVDCFNAIEKKIQTNKNFLIQLTNNVSKYNKLKVTYFMDDFYDFLKKIK